VRQEVEDHLSEAAAAGPEEDAGEAQLRAIRKFGDPHTIASEYAAQSLFRQTRRVCTVAVVVSAGILVSMNVRGAWYGWTQWSISAELQAMRKVGLLIDLYAFIIVLAIGLLGWAYFGTRRIAASFNAAYRDQMKRCLLLCTVAAAPLIATVVTDTGGGSERSRGLQKRPQRAGAAGEARGLRAGLKPHLVVGACWEYSCGVYPPPKLFIGSLDARSDTLRDQPACSRTISR
jgi:hypothetical protein